MNPNVPRKIPHDYVPKYVSQLSLSGGSESIALNILDHAVVLKLTTGRAPSGMAAAAIYIASLLMDEKRIQKNFADIGKVTEVTIRNRYKELVKNLMIEVNL
jgi:transcription initiation factor TFIIB